MAEENKDKKPVIQASTKDHSVASDLGKYVMDEYIVPKTKDVLHDAFSGFLTTMGDAFQGALNKAFYGEDNPAARMRNGSGQTSYTSFYSSPQSTSTVRSVNNNLGQRSSTEVKYIWVKTEDEARQIVGNLQDLITTYGKAKVADLYEMLQPKVPITFQDYKFGWVDSRQMGWHREWTGEHHGEFLIDLPKPINVEDK